MILKKIHSVFLYLFISGSLLSQKLEHIKNTAEIDFQNLYRLNDSIFRSEQPTRFGMKELEKYGFKSILNLRSFSSDKNKTKGTSLQTYHEHINTWTMSEDELRDALRIILTSPKPLLIHCKHGSDRTGTVIAAYRIVFEGWTKEAAIAEMLQAAYGFHPCFQNLIFLLEHLDTDKIKRELSLP